MDFILGRAGLDVIDDEFAGRNPFFDLPQVLVTLHLGGASRGSTTRMVERSAANVRRFLAGEAVRDLVPGLKETTCSGSTVLSGSASMGASSENGGL